MNEPTEPLTHPHRIMTSEGWHFHMPLGVLRQAAEVTEVSFIQKIHDIETFIEQLNAPDDFLGDVAEPDPRDEARERIHATEDAANEARKAFAITAYHHWEHAVSRGIRLEVAARRMAALKKAPSGKDLDQCARDMEWTCDPAMARIRTLVNLLKHDSVEQWLDLQVQWPGLWQPAMRWQNVTDSGYANAIRLSHEQLTEIFNIVKQSGPPFTRAVTT